MNSMSALEPHRFAELFPPLSEDEAGQLREDIAKHGQREPVTLYEGRILDGMCRARACRELHRVLKTRVFRGSEAEALAFVVSVNFRRRHLNESQRGMVAARLATLGWGRKKSGKSAALSQADAARMLAISERTVRKAAYVQRRGSPAEIRAVERGEMRVDDIERSLRAVGPKPGGRDRDARQFYEYVRRLPAAARAFAEIGRRVQRLATELQLEVSSALDTSARKAIAEAAAVAGELGA